MLIPALIGLIISNIFLNFNPFASGPVLISGDNKIQAGRVLGADEKIGAGKIRVQENNYFGQAVNKVMENVQSLPLPDFLGLSWKENVSEKLPISKEKSREEIERMMAIESDFTAENGLILDYQSNSLLFSRRIDEVKPIASITKLFTAYVFLDYNPGWDNVYEIKSEDRREGGKIYLFKGDRVTIKNLFYFSLVGSDNTATAALVASTGLSEEEFVKRMNDKIKDLGFAKTRLVEPVGLSDDNVSTAREIALFAQIALAKEEIKKATLEKTYEFTTKQGRKKRVKSTNDLLNIYSAADINFSGGKTGYLNSSGYCLVGRFDNINGQSIITVVLGADSNDSRFSLTEKMVQWYFGNKP